MEDTFILGFNSFIKQAAGIDMKKMLDKARRGVMAGAKKAKKPAVKAVSSVVSGKPVSNSSLIDRIYGKNNTAATATDKVTSVTKKTPKVGPETKSARNRRQLDGHMKYRAAEKKQRLDNIIKDGLKNRYRPGPTPKPRPDYKPPRDPKIPPLEPGKVKKRIKKRLRKAVAPEAPPRTAAAGYMRESYRNAPYQPSSYQEPAISMRKSEKARKAMMLRKKFAFLNYIKEANVFNAKPVDPSPNLGSLIAKKLKKKKLTKSLVLRNALSKPRAGIMSRLGKGLAKVVK